MGGLKATRELIELCHMDKGKYVLDVGITLEVFQRHKIRNSQECE